MHPGLAASAETEHALCPRRHGHGAPNTTCCVGCVGCQTVESGFRQRDVVGDVVAMSKHKRPFSDRILCGARFGGMVLGRGDETRIEWLIVWQRLILAGPPQEMLLRRNLTEEILPSPTSPPTSDGGVGPTTDPFLGGDFHSRQESADSGLGLGPNYSLPHTPEDFLSSMDDSIDAGLNDGELPALFRAVVAVQP